MITNFLIKKATTIPITRLKFAEYGKERGKIYFNYPLAQS